METKSGATRGGRVRKVRCERLFSRSQVEQHATENGRLFVRRYDSIGEWLNHAEWWWFEQCGRSADSWFSDSQKEWLCGRWGSLDRGLDALRNGEATPEALARMEMWRDRISLEIDAPTLGNTRRRHFVFSEEGDEVDPDRFNAEHDRPWRTMRRGRVAPIVRFGIDATAVGSFQSASFDRVGGLAAAACDVLARQGRSVEVVLMETEWVTQKRTDTDDRRGDWVHLCTLKSAHEPMDLGRIASVASPIFARLLCHATDVFDAGQYQGVVSTHRLKASAEILGIDCLLDQNTTGADIARTILLSESAVA